MGDARAGAGNRKGPYRYAHAEPGEGYANYQMQPGAWTVVELLHRYFVFKGQAYIDESTFYKDVTEPAAQVVIRQHLRDIKESIPLNPTLDIQEDEKEDDNGG